MPLVTRAFGIALVLLVSVAVNLTVYKMAECNMPFVSPREKQLLRRFAAGKTDHQIAVELGDREIRIAAQRQRLTEKFQICTQEQLVVFASTLARWSPRKKRDP